MAERLRRRQDDDCAARSADPSLRNHRDRKRELALQAPRLSRCTAPACPGGQTGTSRAALRRTRGGHSAPRGSLLFATGTSLNLRPRGVTIGRRSGVKLQRRLTLIAHRELSTLPKQVQFGLRSQRSSHRTAYYDQFSRVFWDGYPVVLTRARSTS